jgi:hypothetical protein
MLISASHSVARGVLVVSLLGASACVAKNGSEVQGRGTTDTGTSAPATRPTNTNANTSPAPGGNAATQGGNATSQGGAGAGAHPADSTPGTPVGSDSTHRRRP